MIPDTQRQSAQLFWQLAAQLRLQDSSVVEGTIMNGRCLRVGKEFLALVDYKGSGLVVKLPKSRVAQLVAAGKGRPFAPAGRVFGEWVSVPEPDRRLWRTLLHEGVVFAKKAPARSGKPRGSSAARPTAQRSQPPYAVTAAVRRSRPR